MSGQLSVDRVDQLHVRVTYSRMIEGPAHDVFLADVDPLPSTTRFDEAAYLAILEPVLHAHGKTADACSLRVSRTHRSWSSSVGEAEIAVALSTGRADSTDAASTESVRSTFRTLLAVAGDAEPLVFGHPDAVTEARLRVERAYASMHADRLSVTDEEHVTSEGMWSVGLVHSDRARFRVLLGFVDGDLRTTHIRRVTGAEVVDSVGTE